MARGPQDPYPDRDETMELREVKGRHVEPGPVGSRPARPGGTEWVWLVLLVLVVLGLVGYVLTRGEPRAPQLPEVEVPRVGMVAPA